MAKHKIRVKAFIIANMFLVLVAVILSGIFSKRYSSSAFKEAFRALKNSKELL